MTRKLERMLLVLLAALMPLAADAAAERNPAAVTALLQRVTQAADRFVTVLDEGLAAADGREVFVITAEEGKPCVKGSSLSAVTTGLGWYLNHYANVNLTWNRLSADLTAAALPLPQAEERHTCSADYRYYLNYCTFSYSMSVWTWERWQQEIDWMALHGINMPLQIVGLDALWHELLTKDLGYTEAEANKFIAGPCFQAWWGMNNLEGWGGPNPAWWYTRQARLAADILERERELGMQPVLPGYAGMVPSDIAAKKGYNAINQGGWCAFTRPYILDPNSAAFAEVSALYYRRLEKLMGTSEYYSMDPFHEGANTSGIDVPSAYRKIGDAMLAANPEAKWVIQFWQWSGAQYNVLDQVDKGRLIVLDLFSDAHTHFGAYKGHDAVWCSLPNFGGRTGFFGRFDKVIDGYFSNKAQYANIKGIGATPEAIESVPVLYDILFELPWHSTKPDGAAWMKRYATSRYGQENASAQLAWDKLRTSPLNCTTGLQGPVEAVVCARPAFNVDKVSSWGGAAIFYDPQEVIRAAHLLLAARGELDGDNYSYDLTDIARQALTDYGSSLLKAVAAANAAGDKALLRSRSQLYLDLILDLDRLLGTNKDFRLGRWTQLARGIADEAQGTTEADRQWLELNNARTLITTWGARANSESGGLRDYSYREWNGMMKDFYYPRWKAFFDNKLDGKALPDWFDHDWAWAHNAALSYTAEPEGKTSEVAAELLAKYFLACRPAEGAEVRYVLRGFADDARREVSIDAFRGERFACPVDALPESITATLGIDLNGDGLIAQEETFAGTAAEVPADAVTGKVQAVLRLSDGTEFTFSLVLRDNITAPRTVSATTADANQGSVSITGAEGTSITNDQPVTITAKPVSGYDFYNWTDAEGQPVSTDNPYVYYGKEAASFTANFIVNKWGAPAEDLKDINDIRNYEQYVTRMSVTQNGGEPADIYTADACPDNLFHTTRIVNAPAGSEFSLSWQDTDAKDGLAYCRLSAYIDLNSDGDFDDPGEFIAVVGDKNTGGNRQLSDGSLNVLLPFAMPQGITHIRLRFDGSYTGGWDETTDAKPAKATTQRMVYDIPLNITEYAAQASTVTVKSADLKRGTVDANGQPDTYTYKVGEDIVLRCYPAEGYKIQKWTDQHGRELPAQWMDGNNIRFKPFGNATVTAHFVPEQKLAYGDWQFSYDECPAGVIITGVEQGSGELDLTQANSLGATLLGISPQALRGNTALTALRLPASPEVALGSYLHTKFTGAGVGNTLIAVPEPIPGNRPWTLTLCVATDGSSFNQWGSGLFATGTNPLADSFSGGFQLYLKSDGRLVLKCNSGSENIYNTSLTGNFTVTVSYDGAGKESFTLTTADGKQETKQFNARFNDITTFSCALPAGIDLTHIFVADPTLREQPFKGCTALTDISVQEGNPTFASVNGLLYDATATTLLAYPEGRLTTRPFRLKTAGDDALYAYAFPYATAAGEFTDGNGSDRRVRVAGKDEADFASSLWQLVPIEGGNKVMHLNGRRFFGGYSASSAGRVELPTSPDQWHGVYAYNGNISEGLFTLDLTCGGHHTTCSGGEVKLSTTADDATTWVVEELDEMPLTVSAAGYSTLCLPFAADLPEGLTAWYADGNEGDVLNLKEVKGTVPANFPVILQAAAGTYSLRFNAQSPEAPAGNILTGTLLERHGMTPDSYYGLGYIDQVAAFYLASSTAAPANKAILFKDQVEGGVLRALRFGGDITGIGGINTEGNDAPRRYYDLNGRRVAYPVRGIYVDDRGQKVFVK